MPSLGLLTINVAVAVLLGLVTAFVLRVVSAPNASLFAMVVFFGSYWGWLSIRYRAFRKYIPAVLFALGVTVFLIMSGQITE